MKGFYLLSILLLIIGVNVQAAPGDTTIVQSHTATQLSYFGDYDSPVVFADTNATYRNITMTFTLGKYQCPGSPQYCSDWDYTVQIFLITPTGTLELGRLVTPYAGISRFPMTWKHRYNFDVTDYAQYLKGNNTIRVHYSGYSGGFTANIKFTAIEGTPPRNVLKIDRLWAGSFDYGKPVSIENQVIAKQLQMPTNAQNAVMKFTITGHGSNGDNCSEFCSKYYQVKVDGNLVSQTNIWRDNCGLNNLYPQTGTWVYDRASWCPGDVVYANYHPLPVVTNGNFLVDVDFQPYQFANSQASYTVEGQVIYYGPFNQATDAALESIISPNDYEGFFRSNPVCDEVKIKVRNTGSTSVNTLKFEYGVIGFPLQTITKTVSVLPDVSQEISLPGLPEFQTMPVGVAKFVMRILETNGAADNYAINNEIKSDFTPMPVWPNKIAVRFVTNAGSAGGYNETNWRVLDAAGNTVFARINNTNNTTYNDTLALPSGCYRLVVEDAGCDGLQWWANPNQGAGSLTVRDGNTPVIKALKGYFGGDFGCGFTQAFRIQTVLGTGQLLQPALFTVSPNPANDFLKVSIQNQASGNHASLDLFDTIGRKVYSNQKLQADNVISTQELPSGVYILRYQTAASVDQQQIVITH